jgi:CrcB protein
VRLFWLVVAGGATGTLTRHAVSDQLNPEDLVPLGTLAVNVAGAFVLGALLTVLALRGDDTGRRREARLLLGTGFLGGFTTYSALAVETQTLLRDGHVAVGLAYALVSVAAGLVAALIGVTAGRAVVR